MQKQKLKSLIYFILSFQKTKVLCISSAPSHDDEEKNTHECIIFIFYFSAIKLVRNRGLRRKFS